MNQTSQARRPAPLSSLLWLATSFAAAGMGFTSCSGTEASSPHVDFVVSVVGETFVMRAQDAETIRQARENRTGGNGRFPIGPLRRGDGGFNAPWSWHLDPADVRMTEAAIELCDGRPSYVEAHVGDYPTYCPWAARVMGER
ncbi:MAG: hypothetical protein ACHQKZ_00640 [Solirubrobacterales bacterium]